ncbi:hypothetical protein JTB14_003123 [Gonioctena quinquepunctata]|nr:hypothetical protein JTB14_003123 [Gonioctena quinquepunctata]
MIAEDMKPLRFGEHLGFKKCMEGLGCRYTIPTTTYVKEKLLPEEYQRVKDLLQIELNSICYCAITTYMWISAANGGLLAVIRHYVTNTTDKLKSVVLNTMKIEQNHTGEVISKTIFLCHGVGIRHKVTAVVTDNGSNMLNAVSRFKLRHISCFGHTLNLSVTDVYKLECFNRLIEECKSIATFLRSSTLAADKLRFHQSTNGKKQLKPIQEVSTRWNSTYFMIKRLVEIRTELALAINVCEKVPMNLSAEEYNVLEEFISILEPFEIATNEISGDQYITISLIIPLIRGIVDKLLVLTNSKNEESLMVLNSVKEFMKLRLKPYESRTPCIIGAMLDPRIKRAGFRSVEDQKKASQYLINELTAELNLEAAQNEVSGHSMSVENPEILDKIENLVHSLISSRRGFTLEEALQMVYEDDLDVRDIFIEPPEANVLTDEDSGDEEDRDLVDNLSGQQLLPGAELRVNQAINEEPDEPVQDN